MPTDIDPVVGSWYRRQEKGQEFTVLALDEDEQVVELQHFDGDVEEISLDDWYRSEVRICEPPENWTGPFDDVEPDDLGYTDTGMASSDWSEDLSETAPPEAREDDEDAEDDPFEAAAREALAGEDALPDPDELADETNVSPEDEEEDEGQVEPAGERTAARPH